MRGRKPKPVEQQIAEGNPGKRALPEPVHISSGEALYEPPEHLLPDAKRFWARTIPVLDKIGMLDGVDSAALEMAATAYARFRGAQRTIADEGAFQKTARGGLKEHPAVGLERRQMEVFLRFAEQYGLTPVARTRLGLAKLEAASMADEMQERFGKPKLRDADAMDANAREVPA